MPSEIAGLGFFAKDNIIKGEILAVKTGHVVDEQTVLDNADVIKDSELQIADNLFLAPMSEDELGLSMIYYNHSCEPNMGIKGNVVYVAMRDIEPGEELTVDYATYFSRANFGFACACGAETCRKRLTGEDWKIPELQQKYAGYFSWYLEEKIRLGSSPSA